MERKFHGSESSLCGLFAPGNESAEARRGLESIPLSVPRFFLQRYRSSLKTGPALTGGYKLCHT